MPPPQGSWNPIEGPGDFTTTKEVHSDTYPGIDPTKADFSGRAVFVTGASKGLGRSIAISFAKAGASYIAIGARSDLSQVEEAVKKAAVDANKKPPQVLCLSLDVTDVKSVGDTVKRIEDTFGKLDIVINNAGVLESFALVADTDPDEWWRTWDVNVKGPYLVSRACLPLLLKGGDKTIITVSSVGAFLVMPHLSAYQPSKLAIVRFTEFIAEGYKDKGVIAFSVHPGNVVTDIVGNREGLSPDFKTIMCDTPELCGDSLAYLTNERRSWLSGRYINCTWDLPELTSPEKVKQIVDGDMLKAKLVVP